MAGWRRITKGESASAFRARRYTRAAPGKFKAKSKSISFRQFQQKGHGGKTIERQIKERRAEPGYFLTRNAERARKAMETRGRNRELKLLHEEARLNPKDAKLINKAAASGFNALSDAEKQRFKQLFTAYPQDLVRKWLGSNEASRARRLNFRRAA